MNIHEYQAKELLGRFNLNIPKGILIHTPTEAESAAHAFGLENQNIQNNNFVVIKAQIHSGGRGKAGGVKIAKTPEAAKTIAEQIFNTRLVTAQTGPQGKQVYKCLVVEGCEISKEFYLALIVNRESASISIMASTEGGIDIEEVSHKSPEKLITCDINMLIGLQDFTIRNLSLKLGFGINTPLYKEFSKIIRSLFDAFTEYDCSMIEINPLVLTKQNSLTILDCKMSFDDNALFRHADIKALHDETEDDPRELEAAKYGLSYISLNGNIGCLVNGAGLAMATADMIKQNGGEPANFLDIGGGASQESVTQAFRIILQDPSVKGIFLNIFGGIMKCDVIANGVIAAIKELGITVPLVVRLEGTNVELGKKILEESGLNIIHANNMLEGAKKIIAAVRSV